MTRVAIDIQPSPPDVFKPLPGKLSIAVTLFYLLSIGLLAYAGYASWSRIKIEQQITEVNTSLSADNERQKTLEAETLALQKRAEISTDLTEWLAMSPPAQAMILLLARQVEPNISFSKLVIELEPGAPNAKITLEILSADQDNSARQINRVQAALEKANFKTVNIDADQPTPEGWRFVTTVALPRNGEFQKLVKNAQQ